MIYEIRTYKLYPNCIDEFERRFAEVSPHRQKYSPLGAFWHTEIGPLNEVVHVWPYHDLDERIEVREAVAKDPHWPPKVAELQVQQRSEVFYPAPFMRPLHSQEVGPIFEMLTYTYKVGAITKVLKLWEQRVGWREKLSPLVACWYSDIGGLNELVHVWAYTNFEELQRVQTEATKDPSRWPPPTQDWLLKQEAKILLPASFSPVR